MFQNETLQNLKKNWIQNITILLIHCFAFSSILYWNHDNISLLIFLVYLRVFFVAGGIHRYFSHKSFKLNRFWQFIFAVGGTLCLQNSIFWWAERHRQHHRYADTAQDPHERSEGAFWSHILWLMEDTKPVDVKKIPDLAKYPELRFLDSNYQFVNAVFALSILVLFGTHFFAWGYCLATVISWHLIFVVNSLCHRFGYKNFDGKNESRNIWVLSLINLGEGLHNNHHERAFSPNNRVKKFELDLTYCILWLLSKVKIVRFKNEQER